MKFKKLSEYLEKIEKISGRLEMTDLLVEVLKELKVSEAREAIYLMLGNLAPKYRKVDFNIAEKMGMRAVAMALGEEEDKIRQGYKSRGDLGDLIVDLEVGKERENLEIVDVYERLRSLAEDNGNGSQERKINALAELMLDLDSVSAKFVMRVVLGKLRLGFSEKTLLDALSVMEGKDKSLRKDLDSLFQVHPDLGEMVRLIKKGGVEELKKEIGVEAGVPVLPALCQRLNTAEEIVNKMGKVGVERKFDGTRVQIHVKKDDQGEWQYQTFTRNLEETTHMFPELMEVGKWLKGEEMIFDSEAVGVDKKTGEIVSFQKTITRKRKHGVKETASELPLRFYVFDVLYKDGKSLLNESYEDRREVLKKSVSDNDVLVVDEVYMVDKADRVHELHEKFLNEGYEGAVIKQWQGGYLPGRQAWNWVKIKESEGKKGKLTDTLDLVVMGYYRGRGKRASFGLGAFLVGVKEGEKFLTLAKIGTGLTDDQFREIKRRLEKLETEKKPKNYMVDKNLAADVWVEPSLVVEIAADEITKSPIHSAGWALRFPRLVRFRDDKSVEEMTERKEIDRIRKG